MNKDVRRELHEAYHSKGVVLVLGAGVSTASGIPGWSQVLKQLTTRYLGSGGEACYRALNEEGYTLPAIAGMLEAKCGSQKKFTDHLRDELYRGFEFYRKPVTPESLKEFKKFVGGNETLRAVAALCVRRDATGCKYERNPRVHAIVNFNFDAVFREYMRACHDDDIVRTIDRPSAGTIRGRINIYHMHGFLRFDPDNFDPTKEAPDARVFTEQEYFDFFNNPNSIYNYSFLYLLREHPCVFIGLSLKDDNIRRLLHYSRSERVEGYHREGREKKRSPEGRSKRHFALLRSTTKDVDALVESSLDRLGVNVVWFGDYPEVPAILGDMYGDDWVAAFGMTSEQPATPPS